MEMENLSAIDTSNIEKDGNYERVVHKRRSSVFQSRLTAFDECEGTQSIVGESTVNAKGADGHTINVDDEEESFDLRKYIESLREERKLWQEMLKQRKTQRRNLTREKLCLESHGQVLDLSVLSDSERAFVLARPNYDHICKANKKLSDVALKVATLNQLVQKLNQRVVTRMEEGLLDTTKKVIELSN